MSGAKQHFIPQALLRGFGVHKGAKWQVCVYPRDATPFVATTEGIAARRYFYSEPSRDGSPPLDDEIMSYEQALVPLL